MTRSRLLLTVAAVLAGVAGLFVVLGAAFNPVLAAAATPFGLAAGLLWYHATGRLAARVRRTAAGRAGREQRRRTPGSAARGAAGPTGRAGGAAADGSRAGMNRREALAVLGLGPDADQGAIRRAYRERAKAVHPDADGGDEAAFRRVTAAYRRLRRR